MPYYIHYRREYCFVWRLSCVKTAQWHFPRENRGLLSISHLTRSGVFVDASFWIHVILALHAHCYYYYYCNSNIMVLLKIIERKRHACRTRRRKNKHITLIRLTASPSHYFRTPRITTVVLCVHTAFLFLLLLFLSHKSNACLSLTECVQYPLCSRRSTVCRHSSVGRGQRVLPTLVLLFFFFYSFLLFYHPSSKVH